MLSPEGRLLFTARAVRTFAFGWLSVVLALYLTQRGLSASTVGAIFTATMVEDALLTMALAAVASRWGEGRIMALTAPLMTVGGLILASVESPWLLALGAVLGTLSPNGQEAGPFAALEQARLPDTVAPADRTRMFGWYNVVGYLPAAFGSLCAGAWLTLTQRWGWNELAAYRAMLWAYAAAGLLLALLYTRVPPRAVRKASADQPALGALGLHRSRTVVLQLAALGMLDSLAGGFILQSLLAYWFHVRYGVGPELLGPLFFGTNLLSAVSFLLATRVAARIGLLNTMVFTHLPSNVLLLLVPLMPTFPLAVLMLLARHVLSQMDVPTRQAYTMALVAPEERAAAAGITASARALAQASGPLLAGVAMTVVGGGLPFFIAGGLKIVYDVSLYFRFRGVRLES
jgi:MFS family permease